MTTAVYQTFADSVNLVESSDSILMSTTKLLTVHFLGFFTTSVTFIACLTVPLYTFLRFAGDEYNLLHT